MRIPIKTVFTALLVTFPAWAGLAEFEGQAKTLNGVSAFPTAKVKAGDKTATLTLSGAGIRQKTKVFLTFNVYSVSSYVEDVATLRRAKSPLEGARAQKVKALKLTMLRNLSAAELRTAFEEALLANGVDLNAEHVQGVFAQWQSGMTRGQSATLVGYEKANGDEMLQIEIPTKTITVEGKSAANDFWKIWFGEGDEHIKALQKQLVGKDE